MIQRDAHSVTAARRIIGAIDDLFKVKEAFGLIEARAPSPAHLAQINSST